MRNIIENRLNILIVIFPKDSLNQSVKEKIFCIEKETNHNVRYLDFKNISLGEIPFEIKNNNFDAVVFVGDFTNKRWNINYFDKIKDNIIVKYLNSLNCRKILIPDKENIRIQIFSECVDFFDIDYFISDLPKHFFSKFNFTNQKIKILRSASVIIDQITEEKIKKGKNEKTGSIGYLNKNISNLKGDYCLQNNKQLEKVLSHLNEKYTFDVEIQDAQNLSNNNLINFISDKKAILLQDNGSSLWDFDGEVYQRIEAISRLYPDFGFEQVKDACYNEEYNFGEFSLVGYDILFAIYFKTLIILPSSFESEILVPGDDYFQIDEKLSNLDKLTNLLNDEAEINKLTKSAFYKLNKLTHLGRHFSQFIFENCLMDISYEKSIRYQINQKILNADVNELVSIFKRLSFNINSEIINQVEIRIEKEKKLKNIEVADILKSYLSNIKNSFYDVCFYEYEKREQLKDFFGIRSILNELQDIGINDRNILQDLIKNYYDLGEFEIAFNLVNKNSTIEAPEKSLWIFKIFYSSERITDARNFYKDDKSLNKNDPEIIFINAKLYSKENKKNKAVKELLGLLEILPDNLDALLELGKIYFSQGKYEDAINIYLKAMDINPKLKEIRNGYSEVKKKLSGSNGSKNTFKKNGALLIYHYPVTGDALTIIENVKSFTYYSKFDIDTVNVEFGFPEDLLNVEYEVIIMHYSLFGCYPFIIGSEFQAYIYNSTNSYKIAFFQDENSNCPQRFDFLRRMKVDKIYSCLDPKYYSETYQKYTDTKDIQYYLTGYISPDLLEINKKEFVEDENRSIDIGYRARKLPITMGIGSQEKYDIGKKFNELLKGKNYTLDIEVDGERRIHGKDWHHFLASLKGTIGVESGVSLFDVEGKVEKDYRDYIRKNPDAEENEIYENVVKKYDNKIQYRTISPRHFECAALKVCQILFEGEYSGIMKADIHYIPLKKDYSNFDEVMDKFNNSEFRKTITENAYRDLIASNKYTYLNFIKEFDTDISDKGFKPAKEKNTSDFNSHFWWSGRDRVLPDSKEFKLKLFDDKVANIEKYSFNEATKIIDLFSDRIEYILDKDILKINSSNLKDLLEERESFVKTIIELKTKIKTEMEIDPTANSTNKKILMLVADSRIDRRVLDEARSLTKAGYKIKVIGGPTPGDTLDEDTYSDVDISRVSDERFEYRKSLLYDPSLIEIKKQFPQINWHEYFFLHNHFLTEVLSEKADVIVAHDLPQLPAAALAACYHKSFLVYDSHEIFPESIGQNKILTDELSKIDKLLANRVDRFITVNESLADYFKEKYGVKRPDVILNCPAIHKTSFPIKKTNIIRENLNIPNSKKILLFQGNLYRVTRNLENLVSAMGKIMSNDVVLVIMGNDRGIKNDLIELAQSNKTLNSKVYFHDGVPGAELLKYSASADVGVIPYSGKSTLNNYYCTPNKLFEFIAAGVPILANSLPELNRFVSDENFGINMPMDTADEITIAIDAMFSADIEEYKKNLEQKNKKLIWDIQGKKIVKIYNELLQKDNFSLQIKLDGASICITDEKYKEAEIILDDIKQDRCNNANVLNNLAVNEILKDNLVLAVNYLTQAIDVEDKNPSVVKNVFLINKLINENILEGDEKFYSSYKNHKNILILLNFETDNIRGTIKEHILCFEKFSDYKVHYLNINYTAVVPDELKNIDYELIIFHTKFLSARWVLDNFYRVIKSTQLDFIRNSNAVKIAIPQDEFLNTNAICDFIDEFNIDHVFTNTNGIDTSNIYGSVKNKNVNYQEVLTGYLDEHTIEKINNLGKLIPERKIDIGYRAWKTAYWLGEHGQKKSEIAEKFNNEVKKYHLNTDISTKEEDTFLGDDWYKFLLNCKYFIGVEGGSSISDKDGSIKRQTENYLELNPEANFDQVKRACFSERDGEFRLYAISPRHLEACATRTCQILMEGEYNGILKPGIHYIELKEDYSNIDEVLKIVEDDKLRKEITDRVYKDIVESGKYNYQAFVNYILKTSLENKSNSIKETCENENLFVLHNQQFSCKNTFINQEIISLIKHNIEALKNTNDKELLEAFEQLYKTILFNFLNDKIQSAQKLYNIGDLFAAYSKIKDFLELEPNNFQGKFILGNILVKMGDYNSALCEYNEVIELNQEYYQAYTYAAKVYFKNNLNKEAYSYVKQALQMKGNDIEALLLYAELRKKDGELKEAAKVLKIVLNQEKENYYALKLLSDISFETEDYKSSLELQLKLVEKYPHIIDSYLGIIAIAEIVKDDNLLKTVVNMAASVAPENKTVKEKLKMIT